MKRTTLTYLALILSAVIICPGLLFAEDALTPLTNLPTGEKIISGDVVIDRSIENICNVNIASQNAIVEWANFSVAAGYALNFNFNIAQPSLGSILNNVVGSSISVINGAINSNGTVFLVNPNGIAFGSSAQVNCSSLIASTLKMDYDNFLNPVNGQYKFYKDAANNGFIINAGRIAAQPGGYVALLSQAVNNSGTIAVSSIDAKVGRIVLASGERMTVALDDKSQISVAIEEGVKEKIFGPDGNQIDSGIKNSGSILADGGRVTLTAKTLNKVFDYAINNTGIVQAASLVNNDGVIELIAEGAPIINTGRIEAGKVIINAIGTDLFNFGSIISQNAAELPVRGDIRINAVNILQDGQILSNGAVVIDVDDMNTTHVVVLDPNGLAQDASGASTMPDAIIQGNQVRITFKKLGSSDRPIQIKAPQTYIYRKAGDINILDSLGIGTSIWMRGPPEDNFSIIYSKDTNLTLEAGKISLVGSNPIHLYGNITFSNFNITVPAKEVYFEADKTYTILGAFNIQGAYAQHVKLLSSEQGKQWFINSLGSRDLTYIWVEDSYNLGTEFVLTGESTNRGNSFAWDPTRTWTGGAGNWNDPTKWSGGVTPGSGDDAVIVPGSTVTVTANATVNSITFSNTSNTASTLTVNSGIILTVTTGITLQNAAGSNTSATIAGAGTINCASVTVGGTTTTLTSDRTTILTSTISILSISGNLNINGEDDGSNDNDATFALASGSVSVGGTINADEENGSAVTLTLNTGAETGTLTLSGSTPFTNAVGSITFDANGTNATVIYSGDGAQTVKAVTYRNLTLSGSGIKTLTGVNTVNGDLTLSGTATATTAAGLTVDGNLDVGSGTTLTVAGFNITVAGTTSISGTLTVNSTSGTKIFDNIVINTGGLFNSTVNESYSLTGNLQVDGTGSITSGTGTWTFSGTAGTLSGTGSATISSATFTTNYSNSGNFSFSTLNIQGTGTVRLTNNGTITVSTALTGTDGLTQGVDSILNIGGTSTITTLTATASGNTVNYSGAAQTVKATTYTNLTLSGSGTKTLGGDINVANVQVDAGVTVDPNGNTMTGSYADISGTLLVDAATFGENYAFSDGILRSGSTVNYSRAGNQTIEEMTEGYSNLAISGSGTKTLSSATIVFGNLTISAGATLDTDNTNNYALTVSGNWTNSGTFTPRLARVTFDGAGTQALNSGGTGVGKTFYDLTHSGAGTLQLSTNGLVVTHDFTNSDGTFDLNGQNWTMTGATFSNDGTVKLKGNETVTGLAQDTDSGTWEYSGDNSGGLITIKDFGATDYYNIAFRDYNSVRVTFRSVSSLDVAGTFNIGQGTFNANGQTVTVAGLTSISGESYSASTATQTFNGGLRIDGGNFIGSSGDVDINGDFYFSGSSFTAPSGSFTVSGNWDVVTAAGTFDFGTGTVTFDGESTGKTITTSGRSFYNLAFDGIGSDWTLQDALNVANDMVLTSGTLDVAGNAIECNSLSNSGLITTSSGDINITSEGDITAGVITNAGGLVSLTSNSGSILDGNDTEGAANNNITANSLVLSAAQGIGSGDALETQVTNLAARVTDSAAAGDIEITDTNGSLYLNDVTGAWGYAIQNFGSGRIAITENSSSAYLAVNGQVISNGGDIDLTTTNTVIIDVTDTYYDDSSSYYAYIYVDAQISSVTGNITLSANNTVNITINGDSYLEYYCDGSENYSYIYVGSGSSISTAGNIKLEAINTVTRDITADYIGDYDSYDYSCNYAQIYIYGELNTTSGDGTSIGTIDIIADNTVTNTVDGGTYIYYYEDGSNSYAYIYLSTGDGISTDLGTITFTADNDFTRDITAEYIEYLYDYSRSYSYIETQDTPISSISGDITINSDNTVDNSVTAVGDGGIYEYYAGYENYAYVYIYYSSRETTSTAGNIDIDARNSFTEEITADGIDYMYIYNYDNDDYAYNYAYVYVYDTLDVRSGDGTGTGTVDVTATNIVDRTIDTDSIDYLEDYSENYAYLDVYPIYADLGAVTISANNEVTSTINVLYDGDGYIDYYYDESNNYAEVRTENEIYTKGNIDIDATNTVTRDITADDYIGDSAFYDYSSNYAQVYVYGELNTTSGDGTSTGAIDITADNTVINTVYGGTYIYYYYDYSDSYAYVYVSNSIMTDLGNITLKADSEFNRDIGADTFDYYYDYTSNYSEIYISPDEGTISATGDFTMQSENSSTRVITGDPDIDESLDSYYSRINIYDINIEVTGVSTLTAEDVNLNSGVNWVIGNSLTVNGSLRIYSGAALDANGYDITVSGNWTNDDGGTFTPGTGNVTLTGTDRQIAGSASSMSFATLTVDGTYTNNITAGLTILTALNGSGTLTQGDSAVLNISGTSDIANLDADASNNTVNYNGDGDQTVKAADYYNLTVSGSGIKTVDPKAVTITGTGTIDGAAKVLLTVNAAGIDKTYDGDATATVTLSVDNIFTAYTVSPSDSYTAVFDAGKNVGTDKAISVSDISLTGSDADKFTLNEITTASATATITQYSITFIAAADSRVYDGGTASSITPTISVGELQGTDTIGSVIQSFDTKNVGTEKILTPSGTISDDNGGNNYDVTFETDTTGAITAKELTVTGITADNKEYDGTTAAVLNTGGAELVGVIEGDDVTLDVSGAVGTFDSPDAGTGITVTVSGLTTGGDDVSNYSLTQPTTTADITPLPPVDNASTDTNTTTTTTQLSAFEVPRLPSPDLIELIVFQVNTFNPNGGGVYFYHPLTPYDMAAFNSMILSVDSYSFLNGTLSLTGHEGLLSMFEELRNRGAIQ